MTEKLGESFKSQLKIDQEKEIYDQINVTLAQLDTHKYSDEVVNCFIDAAKIEDNSNFSKEISKCEINAHIEYEAHKAIPQTEEKLKDSFFGFDLQFTLGITLVTTSLTAMTWMYLNEPESI